MSGRASKSGQLIAKLRRVFNDFLTAGHFTGIKVLEVASKKVSVRPGSGIYVRSRSPDGKYIIAIVKPPITHGGLYLETKTKEKDGRPSPVFVCSELATRASELVDVELLLVHGWVALHDDGALGELFHLVQQATVVRLQFFGNIGMHAQHDIFVLEVLGNLPHLDVNLVADRGHGFHVAGRFAIRARRADGAFERLLHALTRDRDQAEIVKLQGFGRSTVVPQFLFEGLHHALAVA